MDDVTPQENDSGAVGDAVNQVKDAAASAIGAAKQEASGLASSAKDKATGTIAQSRQTVSHTLTDFAGAIRKAGDELAEHDQSLAGRLVKQAADGLESISGAIANKRPDELLNAAREFGRSNPTAFIAGSVLLGLALGRFAKSSTPHASSDEPASGSSTWPTGSSEPRAIGSRLPRPAIVGSGDPDLVEHGVFSHDSATGGTGMTSGRSSGPGI